MGLGQPSTLRFGITTLNSSTGVQQGDPAGPVLFALALSTVLNRLRTEFPNDVFDIWYADDGYIVGKRELVECAFNILIEPLKAIGLQINFGKCALWSNADTGHCNISNVATVVFNELDAPLSVLGFPVAGNPIASAP